MNEEKILHELKLLNNKIEMIDMSAHIIDGWLPRKYVMRYFDVCDTTLHTLEKSGKIIVSKVGSKKFYDKNSIVALLNKNIIAYKNEFKAD